MAPARSHIRGLVHTYLERRPGERAQLEPLLASLDAVDDPTRGTTLPGHITCSAVVVDRSQRVLHIQHRVSGLVLPPGGHVESGHRTLLAGVVRELSEETGIKPGDLCLTPQLLGIPIDIDVHDIDANPAKGEPGHQHYDFRFVFCLACKEGGMTLQDEEAFGTQWRPFHKVSCPTLRAKLLDSGLDGVPEPVDASVLIHDGHGRYLLHLRGQQVILLPFCSLAWIRIAGRRGRSAPEGGAVGTIRVRSRRGIRGWLGAGPLPRCTGRGLHRVACRAAWNRAWPRAPYPVRSVHNHSVGTEDAMLNTAFEA
ncbi:NUDIX hydrolase [Streptomyces sp. NPDC093149]|uniref:NUDIX hydrolase n=1 Tax=Streptomyces sp. NPDC093149 TaxID=3366031 RepID=UPI0038253B5D